MREGKTLSNRQLFRTEGVLILALSVNHLHIVFQLPKDETKRQKCIPKFLVEKMGKKEKILQNNGNIVCIFNNSRLCQPRSENYKYRSYWFLIFHLLSILKNTMQPSLHFTHVIDNVDLPKASSGEVIFLKSEDLVLLNHLTREKKKKIDDNPHCFCS